MPTQTVNYYPKQSDWFSPNVEYIGLGTAEFTQPAGTIQGPTQVRYDESGKCKIEMTVEKIVLGGVETEDVSSNLPYFFAGIEPPNEEDGWVSRIIPQAINNPCRLLKVTTEEGTYSATDLDTNYHPVGHIVIGQNQVEFNPLQAHFEADLSATASYFVAPLTNFVNNSGWFTNHPLPVIHPLRIRVAPLIPDDLPAAEKQFAYWQQRSGQSVVRFEFRDEIAFIEPLIDHEDRENRLKDGESKTLTTAIMVGSIAQAEISVSNWRRLGIQDLLALLSLATGSHVGCLWLELRDKDRRLVRRIHTNLAHETFKKGLGAIGTGVDKGGLGYLLSVSQKSEEYGKSYLRAVISQIVLGGYINFEGNIEDKLSHFYRALDRLCKEHIPRKDSIFLSPKVHEQFKQMTTDFAQSIEAFASDLMTSALTNEAVVEAEELMDKRIRRYLTQAGCRRP